jgi:hypothetical protein
VRFLEKGKEERGKDDEDKRRGRGDKVYRVVVVVVDSLDSRAGLFNEETERRREEQE